MKHFKYKGGRGGSKRKESSKRGNQIIVIIFVTILSCQQNEHNRKTKQKLNFAGEFTHSLHFIFSRKEVLLQLCWAISWLLRRSETEMWLIYIRQLRGHPFMASPKNDYFFDHPLYSHHPQKWTIDLYFEKIESANTQQISRPRPLRFCMDVINVWFLRSSIKFLVLN